MVARARKKTGLLGIIMCCMLYVACTKYSQQTGDVLSAVVTQGAEWFSNTFTNAMLNK